MCVSGQIHKKVRHCQGRTRKDDQNLFKFFFKIKSAKKNKTYNIFKVLKILYVLFLFFIYLL
jgi:hypothetical protein